MKKTLLASAALLTLVLAGPAYAAHDDHGGQGAATHQGGGHQGGGHQGGGHQGGGQGGSGHQAGGRQGGGHQAGGQGGSLSILAPGGTGGHRNRGGHNNSGATTGGSNPFAGRGGRNNTGATTGGSNPFAGRGGHAGRTHNNAFDSLRRVFNAPHHYHQGGYNRPHGWYAHRWSYGEFLPALFFGRNYWISDYSDFDLSDPPPGTTWVRYGDDALLIDEYTGEVIQVVYGIFY